MIYPDGKKRLHIAWERIWYIYVFANNQRVDLDYNCRTIPEAELGTKICIFAGHLVSQMMCLLLNIVSTVNIRLLNAVIKGLFYLLSVHFVTMYLRKYDLYTF